ncbi:MAG TPA: ABC transporter substrate-binding protein [Streptosporangiaceae bacterium]|nr:ABC transporter substrate-binding protein [Streptosporangiaceae bacterium]
MRFRVTAARALIAASALVVLAACGGGGSSSSAGPGNGGSGGAGSPVHGGNLIFDAVQDAQSMNNTTVFDNSSIWIFEQIFEPLYTVTNDGKGVRPYLATSYSKSADGKTYTFKLRHGVVFSNGKPMTSADVKFSIDQNRKATAGWAYLDSAISSVDDPSPDTVVIHLKFPWAPLLADLSIFANGIVPNNYGGQTEAQFYTHPVGTGPFKWAFWHKGQALKLVKNPHYWQKGLPYLNSITWNDVPSDNTRELNLKGGSAQIDQFPAWSTVASLKTTPNVTMNLFNSTQTNYLAFNEERKPFQDVHVRRAISLAIDRNALVKAVLFGNGKPANSLFPPQVPFYQAATQGLQLSIAQAKAEMAKSSVPHGFATSIIVPSGNSDYLTIATILQAELKKIGIKLTITQLDPNVANNDEQTLKYNMVLTLWTMDIPDPDELATFAVDPKSGAKSFFTNYNNPAVVKAAHKAEVTTDASARQALYNTVQSGAAADAFMAYLYYSPYPYANTSNVHGFFVTPLGNMHMENVWLSK